MQVPMEHSEHWLKLNGVLTYKRTSANTCRPSAPRGPHPGHGEGSHLLTTWFDVVRTLLPTPRALAGFYGAYQAIQDFKPGRLHDHCPTQSLPALLLRGLDPGAVEGPLTRKLG